MRANSNILFRLSLLLAGAGYVAVAAAALPDDQVMRYSIRENPADPDSQVIWTIDLSLTAQASDGNSVGWLIERLSIAELDATGTPTSVWVHQSPTIGSTGGLWWVQHADPQNPVPAEFAQPPRLEGIAVAQDQADPDLDYLVEGVPYTPPDPPVFSNAALDYWFIYRIEPVPLGPVDEGDDEPVVVIGVQYPF